MEGATGSENTGKAAGAAALVISAALDTATRRPARPDRAAARRDPRDPRADRRAGDRRRERRRRQRRRARRSRPGADPSAAPEDQWTLALRLGPGQPRRRGLGRPPRPDPARGGDRQPRLVRAADRRQRRTISGPGAGPLRDRRAVPLEAAVGRRRGAGEPWTTVDEGDSDGEVTDFGIDRPRRQVRAALASYTPPPDPGGPTFSPLRRTRTKNEFTVRLMVTGHGHRRRPASTAASSPRPQTRPCAPASRSGWGPAARRRSATPTSTATTSRS